MIQYDTLENPVALTNIVWLVQTTIWIDNQHFSRSIETENTLLSRPDFPGMLELKENEMVYPLIGLLFDASVFDKMFVRSNMIRNQMSENDYATGSRFYIRRPEGNPQLRSRNPDQINQLIYYIHQRKSTFFGQTTILHNQKKMAIDLIELLNKEYQLQKE